VKLATIIGKNDYSDSAMSPVEKFLRSLHTASKCRYIASARLKHKGSFAFTTTTTLSLGLIFIPLMQNAGLKLAYSSQVLNMIQIFLAVSVLVYSIISSKTGYEIRAEKLNECGDKIKELARLLESDLSKCNNKVEFDYSSYRERYVDIDTDVENHTQLDHGFAKMSLTSFYTVTGIKRIHLKFKSHCKIFLSYYVSFIILALEAIVILDMLNLTSVFSPHLQSMGNI
tara:strand:- start:3545 stop:4228 length:684 start_codon:yes stop_codon:yes gene_type:complete